MNFGEILDAWDEAKRNIHHTERDCAMQQWLDQYPPGGQERENEGDPTGQRTTRSEFAKMPHQAEIDLHGMGVTDALRALDDFIRRAHDDGFVKVLVVHGKGLHSQDGRSVLAEAVRRHLQTNRLAGRIEHPPRRYGGNGALWVLVR